MNFTKAFRIGPYKKHREDVLLDREIAILPTRQPRVEAKFKMREVEADMRKVHQELSEWEKQRQKILVRSHGLARLLTRYTAETEGRPPPAWTLAEGEKGPGAERAKFVMKCPDGDCRGFLSTAYKCGTCQKWACPDCLVVKGLDKDTEHTCDPGQKESVALIIKESKACPKCGERISKIDGCDQMWCVDCHTAFSWATGQLVTGVVHNPHYYEFLRQQGNGVAPRNAGDVPCGGVPYYHTLQTAIAHMDRASQTTIMHIHRITAEITDQRLAAYQGHFNVNDNGDLGMAYLMKEITKEEMKVELAKREIKRNKHLAIRAVLEMFTNTSTMMLNNLVAEPPGKKEAGIIKILQENVSTLMARQSYENRTMMNDLTKGNENVTDRDLVEEGRLKREATAKLLATAQDKLAKYQAAVARTVLTDVKPILVAFENLRLYVNESLLGVSRMKTVSVPQIGEAWRWFPYNKAAPVARTKAKGKKAAAAAAAAPSTDASTVASAEDSEEAEAEVPAATDA